MSDPIERIRKGLATELPGHDSFLKYTGYRRELIDEALRNEPAPRHSAVLIAIFSVGSTLRTVLIKRPEYDGAHSGQVAFPGGRKEPEDIDLEQTARREFTEETGASVDRFEVLGSMSQLYIPPSRSLVTPYVAVGTGPLDYEPDPIEVDLILETDLQEIMEPGILKFTDRFVSTTRRRSPVPYFSVANEVVWGATAMMIAELRQLCGVGLE